MAVNRIKNIDEIISQNGKRMQVIPIRITNPTSGQALSFNASTGKWENKTQ